MRAEIFGFLQQLRFEVTRKDFNKADLQCEMHLSSQIDPQAQVANLLELRVWDVLYSGSYLLRLSKLSSSLFLCLQGHWAL